MTGLPVRLSRSARADIVAIHRHLVHAASSRAAQRMVEQLLDAAQSLAEQPLRGVVVDDLHAFGTGAVHQLLSKPYRILYHVDRQRVLIVLVCDMRRNYPPLLEQRMLAWPPE